MVLVDATLGAGMCCIVADFPPICQVVVVVVVVVHHSVAVDLSW